MPIALRLAACCSLPTAFWFMLSFEARRGGEMADATDLKSVDRKVVWVRLPPSAPIISINYSPPDFCRMLFGGGKVMHNPLKMIARLGLVLLVVAGLQVIGSALGRGRGEGRSAGGPPAGTGVDREIGRSSDASAGRADKGRGTASDKSKGRSDGGPNRARAASEKAKTAAKTPKQPLTVSRV